MKLEPCGIPRSVIGWGMALLVCLGASLPEAAAQQRQLFRHLTAAEGLSQNDVTAIVQDSIGFMWFGTEDGLNRYDGRQFRVFQPDAFDTTSLSHPWVVGLTSSSGAGLWVATEGGGLSRYDASQEKFERITLGNGERVSNDFFVLTEAADGTLWIGTRYDGLIHYDPARHIVTTYRSDPDDAAGLTDGRVTALLEDRMGRVWIGTGDGGLNRLNPATGIFTHYRSSPDPAALPGDHVTALMEDHAGDVWVGTSPGGLSRYDPRSDAFVRYRHGPEPAEETHVRVLFEDPAHMLWIGTNSGLDRLDRSTGRYANYRHNPVDMSSLRPGGVLSLFLDRTGVFWIGTASGINFFEWDRPAFGHINHDPTDPNTIDNPDIWSIYQDAAGILWIGTATGLNRVDREAGTVVRFPTGSERRSGLSGGSVMAIHEDRRGDFWVGTRFGALHRFDRANGRVVDRHVEDPLDAASIRTDTPWRVFEDSGGRFWITSGGRGCLNRMDREAASFRRFCHDPDDPASPSYDIAHDLVESRPGVFWLGTWGGGLDRFDPEEGRLANYRHDPSNPDSPASDFIISLLADRQGVLWLGHYGAGLDRFDPETETFAHYSQSNSNLPNNIILSIEEDATGDLWVSTYRGLARFTPSTGEFRAYGVEAGLQDLEFNSKASFRAPTGELFFGGINGVTFFHPDSIKDNTVPPRVVLTLLRIRGQESRVGETDPPRLAVPFMRSLTLSHDENDVAITFAALHFTDPTRNRYRYRLDGYDVRWYGATAERTARYTNLDPGRYVFRVQAANSDGIWSEEEAALEITVLAPWWRTWWAYVIYAFLAAGAMMSVRRYEMKRLLLKARLELEYVESEKLRELDRTRSRFFANVSHEFRTPLTLTIGPLDDISSGIYGKLSPLMSEQIDLARRNAGRVLELINQILALARLESGRTPLRARAVDFGALVEEVASVFRSAAQRKSIAFHVHVPQVPVEVWGDPEKLETVAANLISNAVKFTPGGGQVTVAVFVDQGSMCLSVLDSGPGIPPAELPRVFDRFYQVETHRPRTQLGTGIGLALAKELVDLHGGTLSVESEEGAGCTFTARLPAGNAHLTRDQIDDSVEPAVPNGASRVQEAGGDGMDGVIANDDDGSDRTTILVVEDHAEVRAFVRRHLEPTYRVIEAGNGEDGLALARQRLPDLVLSDVMMPVMDGIALCRALKSDAETDFIPVILLTAKAATEDKLEGLHERADDYLTKPFDVQELRARVDNIITSRRRLREHFAESPAPVVQAVDTALHPDPVDVESMDALFLERVREAVQGQIGDEDFSVEKLADAVGISRSHLHRRLAALTGKAPSNVIRTMRLERAAQLLVARAGTVSEIAYAVGFKSVSHFSSAFEREFGCRPSRYAPDA